MATATSKIGKNLIFAGLNRILFIPWVYDSTTKAYAKGESGFCLDDVVADTTAIAQDESETNSTDCETRDEPIVENITLGAYTFSCESANIDADILEHCLGYTVKKDANGSITAAYAPNAYVEKYAEIELQFKNGMSIIMPKIKLSSNLDASSMKTGVVRGVISGTAYSTAVEGADGETPLYVSSTPVNTVSSM